MLCRQGLVSISYLSRRCIQVDGQLLSFLCDNGLLDEGLLVRAALDCSIGLGLVFDLLCLGPSSCCITNTV